MTAIVKLPQVRFRQPPERYKLFDPDGLRLPLGSTGYMEASVQLLVGAVGVLQRVRP